jgi:DNA-binding transcriptional MerR regulator
MSDDTIILPIGKLAKMADVSVRALRHYEAMGLLTPSYDPQNGRRRYTRSDVSQVMKITALKTAGLSLRQIGDLLGGGLELSVAVDVQIKQLQALRDKTKSALAVLENAKIRLLNGQTLDVDLLCQMIRSNPMTEHPLTEVAKEYFDDAQMQKIRDRGTSPAQLDGYTAQWSDLIARVQILVDSGKAADSDEALECARQWNALISAFTLDDPKITASLSEMYADKAAWQDRAQMPYSPAIGDFIAEAQGALLERGEGE